ncbi:zinc-ribbon domain-containing protein, partial [Leifsonia kafniensis]|uniref:zinc-ribbon domain-containing protein n=1 Tax=Leifsonia kafniensis TaxID=475957 RepID=UPI0031F12F98
MASTKLPIRVRVRHLETADSFYARLSQANSIAFLQPARLNQSTLRIGDDVVPARLFESRVESLGGLPPGWFESRRQGAAPACAVDECRCAGLLGERFFLCKLCAAGESIMQYPHVGGYVCRRHERWVGPGVDVNDQLPVGDYPSLRRASRTLDVLKKLPHFDVYQLVAVWALANRWARVGRNVERLPLAAHPSFDRSLHTEAATFPVVVAILKKILSGRFLSRLLYPRISRAGALVLLDEVLLPEVGGSVADLTEEVLVWLRPTYFRVAMSTRKDPEGKQSTSYPVESVWQHDLKLEEIDYSTWPKRRFGIAPGFPGFSTTDSPLDIAPSYLKTPTPFTSTLLLDVESDLRMEFWWHGGGKPFELLRSGDEEPCTWICASGHVTTSVCATKVNRGRAVCAFCVGKRPIVGLRDIAATHPSMAIFWHPTRNGRRELRTVSAGSAFVAWWRCPNGHEFQRPICQF